MSNVKKNIEMILDLPGNRKCADCASLVDQDTGWASLNLGVVMCIQCASIHRAMGTHITKIRSFRLDTNAWTDKITNIFTTIGGNDRANRAVWESNLPSFWINPKIDKGSDAIRKEFVLSKYEKQLFLPPDQLRGRINNCLRKMPIEVRQIQCDFWCRGEKKYKTKEFAVIHSRWLSRYNGGKKSKASQQIDLTNFNMIIEENTTGFEEYDGYEFSLYEDTKYIVAHTKEVDMYGGDNEHKSVHPNHQSPNLFAHDEPLLRCRIKDFKQFVNVVKDIRSTMAYYRVYDSLFESEPGEPPLDVTTKDLSLTTTKFLGFAKIGWSKRYFACINGFLYQFKEDVSLLLSYNAHAITVWDLQIIDCVLDENGKRSGSKFAVLIINGNKTISVKFQSGPEAIVFFTKLKQCWTDIRGKYYVDFSVDPPEISGEATGPQPIQVGAGSPRPHHSAKPSFFMPNPQHGGALGCPKEQDALILGLIDEYEKKQGALKQNDIDESVVVLDNSSTGQSQSQSQSQSNGSSTDGDDALYADSGRFELSESESDDALYRQVSRMTAKEKQHLEDTAKSMQQKQINLNVPQVVLYQEEEKEDEDITADVKVMNVEKETKNDSYPIKAGDVMDDSYHLHMDDEDIMDEVIASIVREESDNKLPAPASKPEPEPEALSEYEHATECEPVMVREKAPIVISKEEIYANPAIDGTANISIAALLRKQQQTDIEPAPPPQEEDEEEEQVAAFLFNKQKHIESESEPEIYNNTTFASIDEPEIEPPPQQIQEAEDEQQPTPNTYIDADIDDSTNLSVSTLLNTQKQIELQPEPEPQLQTQSLSEPEPDPLQQMVPTTNVSVSPPPPTSPISPRMSHTVQAQEVDSIAVENDDCQPEPEPGPEPEPEPEPEPQSPHNLSTSQKSHESQTKITMNKQGNVAKRISAFNQKVNNDTDAKQHAPKMRYKNKKKVNGATNQEKTMINGVNDSQPPIKKKGRSKRRKRKHVHRKKETAASLQMAHLKITRWFNIDNAQLAKLNNPSFTNVLQQKLAKYGILSVRKDKKFIKVQISRRIPLPQRQNHWNDTIKLLQDKLQGSDLLIYETIRS